MAQGRMTERLTVLHEYIDALDRTASAAGDLAETLRQAGTLDELLTKETLGRWVELTKQMKQDGEILREGSDRWQRRALARYAERRERASYKLPPYQR